MNQRAPRIHDTDHLALIRQLPCLVCGDNTSTQAAHIRYADRSIAKPMSGMGRKSDDHFVVPLCGTHHDQQHDHGDERGWWKDVGIDPVKVAMAMKLAGNYEACVRIIAANCEHVAG